LPTEAGNLRFRHPNFYGRKGRFQSLDAVFPTLPQKALASHMTCRTSHSNRRQPAALVTMLATATPRRPEAMIEFPRLYRKYRITFA